ncbi:unnamed protein product [Fraxinus pennsylvanica]|uniref:Uncharacterized protein n=1 Tax=Fraxinus pennsylvanica TaxID=56036 RepID=A0AAD1YW21_9LAMI|nr:unnamed protein product [Fraxinus pennsylvanica]
MRCFCPHLDGGMRCLHPLGRRHGASVQVKIYDIYRHPIESSVQKYLFLFTCQPINFQFLQVYVADGPENNTWPLRKNQGKEELTWRIFSLKELQLATNNFNYDKQLGEGGFGSVYWGQLWDGSQLQSLFFSQGFRIDSVADDDSSSAQIYNSSPFHSASLFVLGLFLLCYYWFFIFNLHSSSVRNFLLPAIQNLLKVSDAFDPVHKKALEIMLRERSGGTLDAISKVMGAHIGLASSVTSFFGDHGLLRKRESDEPGALLITDILQRQWKRKGYYRLSTANRKNVKVTRFGAGNIKRSWRIKKFRFRLPSPLKLWYKFKNAYMNMMLKMAVNSGSDKTFGAKRIPKARQPSLPHTNTEFENRLIYEIYKSMVTSLELGYTK